MNQADPHVEDRLLDFAYGELPPPDLEVVQGHLKTCAACSDALAQIQGVRRVMSRLPVETAPETGLDSLLGYAAQAARRSAAGPAKKRGRWALLLPAMGLGALAVIAVVVAGQLGKATLSEPRRTVATSQVAPALKAEPTPADLEKSKEEGAEYATADAKEAKVQAPLGAPKTPALARAEKQEKIVVAERDRDLPADKDDSADRGTTRGGDGPTTGHGALAQRSLEKRTAADDELNSNVASRTDTPAPPQEAKQKKESAGWVGYWKQAEGARKQGDFSTEAKALRNALALAAGKDRAPILDRLCEIEWDTRRPEADCQALQREFPGAWAQLESRQKTRALRAADEAESGDGAKANGTAAPKASKKAATDMQ